MDNFTKQIKELNKAFANLNEALDILVKYAYLNNDLEVYYWKIEKGLHEFNKTLLKELHKQNVEIEFKNITKKLKEK